MCNCCSVRCLPGRPGRNGQAGTVGATGPQGEIGPTGGTVRAAWCPAFCAISATFSGMARPNNQTSHLPIHYSLWLDREQLMFLCHSILCIIHKRRIRSQLHKHRLALVPIARQSMTFIPVFTVDCSSLLSIPRRKNSPIAAVSVTSVNPDSTHWSDRDCSFEYWSLHYTQTSTTIPHPSVCEAIWYGARNPKNMPTWKYMCHNLWTRRVVPPCLVYLPILGYDLHPFKISRSIKS